ncbi:hypothetical protein EBT25_05090 [bacterium]|nr:hypothetical protein [bacterium]
MEARVLEAIKSVAPNTISAQRLAHKLNVSRTLVNGILYGSRYTRRHVKTPLSHTDPHITWSIGTDKKKDQPARVAVNSRNKNSRKRAKTEYETRLKNSSDVQA